MAHPKGDKETGAPRRAPEALGRDGETEEERSVQERTALMGDLFRRALTLGLSGIFTTEQAFRRALGDTLPRDWVDFALFQSERTRDEFVGRLASEVASVLENMNLDEVIQRTLADHRIEVTAQIRLVPDTDPGSDRPGTVKVTRGGRKR